MPRGRPAKISTPKLKDVLTTGDFIRADIVALQAVANGSADSEQQRRAMEWIVYKACDFHGVSFRGTDRETSFAEGKRFVAQQINALLTYNVRTMNSD
jgi:hypothetical protein